MLLQFKDKHIKLQFVNLSILLLQVINGNPGENTKDPYFNGKGPDRTGCTLCGGCMVGCRYNAKNTLDKNYLYLAEGLGAHILPEQEVEDIIPLDDGGYQIIINLHQKFPK